MGFEPTIPVFERAKTVHALDRAAAVIGCCWMYRDILVIDVLFHSIRPSFLPLFLLLYFYFVYWTLSCWVSALP
jgi:hypothetical protein